MSGESKLQWPSEVPVCCPLILLRFCKGSRGQTAYAKRWDLTSASLSSIPGFMELPTCFLLKRLLARSEAVGGRNSPALKLMPCELHPKNLQ